MSVLTKCTNDEMPKPVRTTAVITMRPGRMYHARDGPEVPEFPMNPTIDGCGRLQAEVTIRIGCSLR